MTQTANAKEHTGSLWGDHKFFRRYVEPPFHAEKAIDELLPKFLKSASDQAAKEAAYTLWCCLNDQSRIHFTEWAYAATCFGEVHPAVWSVILTESWLRGKVGSLLSPWQGFRYYQLAHMFERAQAEHLMDAEELAVFESLPDEVTIYRGTSGMTRGKARYGMSWTRDPGWAAWFANRFAFGDQAPLVLKATVSKNNVFAYFSQEDEIVVRPGRVLMVSEVPVKQACVGHAERASLLMAA
jgi:hypothetical protein